jgi:hypothetical protein
VSLGEAENRKAAGFAGLSSLVSDVEETAPAQKPRSEVPPQAQSASSHPGEPKGTENTPKRDEPKPTAQKAQPPNQADADATTGKWMLGIGALLGLLVVIFAGSKGQSPQPSTAPVTTTAPEVIPTTPRRQDPIATQVRPSEQQVVPDVSRSAQIPTETINVLGQQISFSNPSGYCTPGNSERERELMAMSARSVGASARLVHAAVQCAELKDYRAGRRDTLDHWLQIQLIGPKGDFKRLEMNREAFLASIAKSTPRVDAVEINRRLRGALENPDLSMSDMKVEQLGRDGNAAYFSARMSLSIGDSTRPVTGLSGITLLNSLPLTVNVYEGTGTAKSREQLQPVLQELLHSLFTEN